MFPLGLSALCGFSVTVFLSGAFDLLLQDANLPGVAAWSLVPAILLGCLVFALLARNALSAHLRQVLARFSVHPVKLSPVRIRPLTPEELDTDYLFRKRHMVQRDRTGEGYR